MSPLWAAVAVYLCGYGVNASILAPELHYIQDTDPEVAAASHAHPALATGLLWSAVVLRSLIWPKHAVRLSWWRRAAGLPTHR